ncbi:hypothetical protein GCM10009740_08470 [Terrabacter terrae]|uniref:Uncharacterized protein n=1 Tax=Terrabacter terrae TaxID=318434 RepID=A0ABP5FA68_9MICO
MGNREPEQQRADTTSTSSDGAGDPASAGSWDSVRRPVVRDVESSDAQEISPDHGRCYGGKCRTSRHGKPKDHQDAAIPASKRTSSAARSRMYAPA